MDCVVVAEWRIGIPPRGIWAEPFKLLSEAACPFSEKPMEPLSDCESLRLNIVENVRLAVVKDDRVLRRERVGVEFSLLSGFVAALLSSSLPWRGVGALVGVGSGEGVAGFGGALAAATGFKGFGAGRVGVFWRTGGFAITGWPLAVGRVVYAATEVSGAMPL